MTGETSAIATPSVDKPAESLTPGPGEPKPSCPSGANMQMPWLSQPGKIWKFLAWGLVGYLGTLAVRLILGERVCFFYETGLLYLITVGLLGPSFIRARREALRGILVRHTPGDPVFEPLYEQFVNRDEQGWRPIAAGLFTGAFFIIFRWAISWSLLPYESDVTRLAVTLLGAFACGLLMRALWQLLGFGLLVSGMSRELESRGARLFSLDLFEQAGAGYARTAFGASFLSLGLFWLAISSRGLILDRTDSLAETLPFLFLVLLFALIVPLAYLLVPIWRLHRIMAQRKEEIRKLFVGEHTATERRFLEQPNREMAFTYLQGRQVIGEIENLPEWPFRIETLAKLLTLVAIPAILFIFKEIVIDVVVELLKKR